MVPPPRPSRRATWVLAWAALCGAALAQAGCQPSKRTEVVLGIATDLDAPVPLKSIRLAVFREPDMVSLFENDFEIAGKTGQGHQLPASFGVYSETGVPYRIRVILTAFDSQGSMLVSRRATLNLVRGATVFLRLGVVAACVGKLDCPNDTTCIEGQCGPEAIDSTQLPAYAPGLEATAGCASGTAFKETATGKVSSGAIACLGDQSCREGVCYAAGLRRDAAAETPAVSPGDAQRDSPPEVAPATDGAGERPPPVLGRGEACTSDGRCLLGHCVDGVCCESACTGICESCGEANRLGTCVAVTGAPRGERSACAGTGKACGGTCDGENHTACAFPDERTTCGAPMCQDGVAAPAPTCDGHGLCRPSTMTPCRGGSCASTTRCANACDAAGAACPVEQFCNDAGACEAKMASGATCSNGAHCASGNCVDGRCCSQSSCPSCQACTGVGGVCVAIKDADDPDTCRGDKTCDPGGACRSKPGRMCAADSDCATGHCVDSRCCGAAACSACQACLGSGGECVPVTGADDSDSCAGNQTCDSAGRCKAKQGRPCASPADCVGGYCVDGACCESACGGQCEACGEVDQMGTCLAVTGAPRGNRSKCPGAGAPCGGVCDGSNRGACRTPGMTILCGSATCQNGSATPAPACDGAGNCKAVASSKCSSNQCADASRCSGGCDPVTAPCPAAEFCSAVGICQPRAADGNACGKDGECTSGHCLDAHCCSTGTCGTCQACTGPRGTCEAVTNHDDPNSCADDKTCDDAATCKTRSGNSCANGTDCLTGNCVDGRCCKASTCGTCQVCLGGGGTCVPVTSADDDSCQGAKTCNSLGTCKTRQGQTCSVAEDCLGGQCADGVCCETACTGPCEACNEPDQAGKCVAVTGAPRGPRLACAGGGTACGGVCDGSERARCVFPDAQIVCAGPSCGNGIATAASTCDHAGGCRTGQSASCGSNLCANATMCAGACHPVSAPCAAGQFCNASGACQGKLPAGGMCSTDGMCGTGHCVDGKCCQSGACSACQTCSGAGGACVAVIAADDADTCNGASTCDANGVCRKKPGQVCSVGGDCSTGNCVDSRCCMSTSCGTCQSCLGGGGSCIPVTGMEDPGTCAGNSRCDESGGCKLKDGEPCTSQTECLSRVCTRFFTDADSDGYGDSNQPVNRCGTGPFTGYATSSGDCCETDANVHPGQPEFFEVMATCGGFDYDCNGSQEMRYTETNTGDCNGTTRCVDGCFAGCLTTQGWGYGIADCGEASNWHLCHPSLFPYASCGGSSCNSDLSEICRGGGSFSRTQACR